MQNLRISLLVLATLALGALSATAQQLATAKVVDVVGTVTKYSTDGEATPLAVGDLLREGDAVTASALSSAEVIFSNGSEMTIQENTSVNFATLKQAPFAGSQTFAELEADPSTSETVLELNYGKLSGHVKKLRADSRFDVDTPLGTAAIRGTQWEVLLIYNAERGEFILSARNLDGIVELLSRYAGQVEYGEGNVGDKGYDSSVSEEVREVIPQDHTVIVRLPRNDPAFDDLINLTENIPPNTPQPVITPGPNPVTDPDDDDDDDNEDDDFGIIVVSPEGPSAN